MAEFLIQVVDKTNADPYLDVKNIKRGDVIALVEDGFVWGKNELDNPSWRILQAPNISVSAASTYLSPEVDVDPQHPSRMLQRRGFKLDLFLLPAQWAAWVADDTRAQPTKLFSGTGAQILALKVKKPVVADPNILG
jgi:hypothetical protein